MSVLIMAGQLILGLSILVILHEFGHFLAARAFGIKVEKFYLFFDAWGVSLFKFNYKGVEYGIGWLPLGGYVKIAGMIDESMDTDQLAGPPQPWEFRSKPAWQRLIVMLGGIIVNIIVGIFIFWVLTIRYGETYTPNANIKYGIVPGKIGTKMGLKAGDKINSVNGKPIVRFEDLISSKVLLDKTVLNVQRGNEKIDIKVPPTILNDLSDFGIEEFISRAPRSKFSVDSVYGEAKKVGLTKGDSIVGINNTKINFFDEFQSQLVANKGKEVQLSVKRRDSLLNVTAKIDTNGKLGFSRPMKEVLPKDTTIKYGFLGSLPIGATKAWGMFTDNAKGIGKIFTGQVKARKAISSPIGIAVMFGSHVDWIRFWSLVGFLSMVLALTNLLPIPGLDGGHTLFLLIEMVKGKPLSDKFLERAQIVGFVLLISLMVFAFGNDIVKQVMKK
ncbi:MULTISPECIES: RIP metalloprotease RseP [unclassified Mucilaginibacter]|uniref:RIP metalloprotease RseP n=1 Tax=unclassified Mucilaginibacter TaxID=2617802 RepID=UPI002AC9AE66|nr:MULTISPECIES: RIP metalloprotease RseP [unclassified Mucilaginibacter]MEB0260404.1 RIP metalloprotease RseP [Mucilaginibacter sp. 10I4]MEB0279443.1 RIP metalloprotease RseP [Mucilaginibacter sp. 10B2]MEB0300004.1 RIP metalloprotease RseP [Mucilaginibacter sp. 5C4]WPX21818.1 RIP metalloprotease RseP [Mucilaginibacter sp. 5C4]